MIFLGLFISYAESSSFIFCHILNLSAQKSKAFLSSTTDFSQKGYGKNSYKNQDDKNSYFSSNRRKYFTIPNKSDLLGLQPIQE